MVPEYACVLIITKMVLDCLVDLPSETMWMFVLSILRKLVLVATSVTMIVSQTLT